MARFLRRKHADRKNKDISYEEVPSIKPKHLSLYQSNADTHVVHSKLSPSNSHLAAEAATSVFKYTVFKICVQDDSSWGNK